MNHFTGRIMPESEFIRPEHLTVRIAYLNNKGLREYASILSSKVYKDFSYLIEYDPREVNSNLLYFMEISFAGMNLRAQKEFQLHKQGEPVTKVQDIYFPELLLHIEITGNVKSTRGNPCPEIEVSCEQVKLSERFGIDKTKTDKNGFYIIRTERKFEEYLKEIGPDSHSDFKTDMDFQLLASVTNKDGKKAYSPVFYDVCRNIAYDFISGDEDYMGIPEIVKKQQKFNQVKEFQKFAAEQMEIKPEQFDYVGDKLSLSSVEARHYLNARNLSIRFKSNEEIMYALLKERPEADYSELLFQTEKGLVNKVFSAIEDNTIYCQKDEAKKQISELKEQLTNTYIRDSRFLSKYGNIGVLTDNVKKNIVNRTIEWQNDPKIQSAGKPLNDYLLDTGLLNTTQYGKACLYDSIKSASKENTTLAEAILQDKNTSGWSSIDQLISGKSEVVRILKEKNIQIPKEYGTVDEYAKYIDQTLEKDYPSQYLKKEICKTATEKPVLTKTSVGTFLKNNPNFQFGKNHAAVTLNQPGINFTGFGTAQLKDNLKTELQKVEQLYQLTPAEHKSEMVDALWNSGLTSAHKISGYTEAAFTEMVAAQLGSNTNVTAENIRKAYHLSSTAAAMTELVMQEIGISRYPVVTSVIPGREYTSEESNNGLPTIKDLFGSQDYMEYPSCRTLLSPAAYLIDLLEFLKKSSGGEQKLAELLKRRPDIEYILLNCSNTENTMPHIDLVNEVLERAAYRSMTGTSVSGTMLLDAQSTWSPEDLEAYPENTQHSYLTTVYNNLKTAICPWNMPFYFWLEEYRSYLNQLSLSREDIIKYFSPNPQISTTINKGLYEYLGLTAKDVSLFKTYTNSTATIKQHYKNNDPNNRLSLLIPQTGLSYDDIRNLVASHWVNSEGYIVYTKPGEEVSGSNGEIPGTLEATYIQKKNGTTVTTPDPTFFDRFHRFERLRKRLNLKMHELDLILRYLNIGTGSINDTTFNKIPYFFKVWKRLNLKLEETLLLCGDFKYNPYPDYTILFDYLFLRKTENYSLKAEFEKLKKGEPTVNSFTYNNIGTILPYISGIKITEEQYNRILKGEGIATTAKTTTDGLSRIFRVAYLCKALNITEEEFYFLKGICGVTDLKNPESLLRFISYVDEVLTYGFSIPDLAYILNNQMLNGNSIYKSTDDLVSGLKSLQDELKPLDMEYGFYRNHITKNINAYFENSISTAIGYIFRNFTTADDAKIRTFISKHPDLFCNFNLNIEATGVSTTQFFLNNRNDTELKLRAVLYRLGLEDTVQRPSDDNQKKGKYYSEEDIKNLFRKIKSTILINILDGKYTEFRIVLEEKFLNKNNAVSTLQRISGKKKQNIEVQVSRNKKEAINEDLNNKYAPLVTSDYVDLSGIIDIQTFIANNSEAFPSITSFLWPNTGNNQFITEKITRYKKFVLEKDLAVNDEKLSDLRDRLSKHLDGTDFDLAVEIITAPEKAFQNGDPDFKLRDFISNEFKKFMPASEAIGKLYKRLILRNDITNFVRYEYLDNYCDRVDLVLDYLNQESRIDIIVNHFVNMCGIGEEYILRFLFDYYRYQDNSGKEVEAIYAFLDHIFTDESEITANAPQIGLMDKIYRLAQFVNTFKISQEMLDEIHTILEENESHSSKFSIINIFDLSNENAGTKFSKYLNLSIAIGLSHTYFTEDTDFFRFFNKNINPASLTTTAREYIAKITGCTVEDQGSLNSIFPTDLYITWFRHLLECQRIIGYLGVSAATIKGLNKDDTAITLQDAQQLRQIVKNKYSEEEWNKIAADLRDPLRIKQRDALRDYLILNYERDNVTFSSSNDLFNYYLIDTEMIPYAKTSRIIQATLSIQLFIQRILMGMEKNLSFQPAEKDELVWRRNYRVWEANRKILFFPENWLDPELRYDKTPIFKEVEEMLSQDDIDELTVTQLYQHYIEKLDEISNLEILTAYRPYSMYNTETNFIDFVGRTKGQPHKYFYRRMRAGGFWEPWEEINNGIKADMVKLAYWKGHVYMFWPEVSTTNQIPEGKEYAYYGDETVATSTKYTYTSIRMAWSVYKDGKWSKAVFSDDTYVETENEGKTTNIVLTSHVFSNEICIRSGFTIDNRSGFIGWRCEFFFDGSKISIKYNADKKRSYAGYDKNCILVANFGENQIHNNKALCTSGPERGHFWLSYRPETIHNPIIFNVFNYGYELLSDQELHPLKYKILYDSISYYENEWQLYPDQLPSYFKPIILEDELNGKTFLGIPYLNDGNRHFLHNVGGTIRNLSYKFLNFYYPYIRDIKDLIKEGDYMALFESEIQDDGKRALAIDNKYKRKFKQYYGAYPNINPVPLYEEISFGKIKLDGDANMGIEDPYSIYNWEMFYHIPMLIADNLSRNMQFEAAQKWYHFIFDPTVGGNEAGAKKYWKIKPFRDEFNAAGQLATPDNINQFLDRVRLNEQNHNKIIEDWEKYPFNAHLVAKTRVQAYMQYVVMKYLENLVAWGDMYFTKDTMEDINQATLLYILAADMLGVRPQKLEGTLPSEQSYSTLKNSTDDLSNVYEIIEGLVTVMVDPNRQSRRTFGMTQYRVSYFGSPHNPKMEEYWDMVADRLFKIRNCMNIQGITRELPLTSPPIDPGAVAAAMAAGADLSTALNTLSAPLPLYRFSYMLQKAMEFTNDVKSLGNTLLSVLEKNDAEEMAILRTTHEKAIMNSMTSIRQKAIEEAVKQLESLEISKTNIITRRDYYKNKKRISDKEQKAITLHRKADELNEKAADHNARAAAIGGLAQFEIGWTPKASFGGLHLGTVSSALAAFKSASALKKQNEARETDVMASYERRFEDWEFQAQQAEGELVQIEKQIASAKVRIAMAERELENHEKQMELKEEEFEFMKEKFTNKQLYNWMKGQVSKLYQQSYQMAHKLALAAEKAYVFEKQKDGYSSFITSAYWDNLKQGLMSGELLYQDLRRLEVEYMETNVREIELTRDVPLSLVDPEALIELRKNGLCNFEIPEEIYDIDHPGHYMRRIKSVSISIPSVTGPYSGVTCKLSMLNNRFRKSTSVGEAYRYKGIEDSRFIHNIIGIQSIATSTGNNDSGMFEFSFRDERYLPFEGAGAIGRWQVELPNALRKFNYGSISDVILHVKYTARDAGGLLKEGANNNILDNINLLMEAVSGSNGRVVTSLNLKNEFADQFYALCQGNDATLTLAKKHLPFMVTDYVERNPGKKITIQSVSFSPNKVMDNPNLNTVLTDNGILITLTRREGEMPSAKDDMYMTVKFMIN